MLAKVIGVLLLATFCSSRSVHQQALNYSQSEYLSSLGDIYKKVRADWEQVRNLINNTKEQLRRANISNADKVTVLEESLAEERDVLARIETYVGLPFGLKPCVKTFNLTDQDKRELSLQLHHIRESISKLQNDIDLCGDCTRLRQLRKQISLEEQYLVSVETLANADCRYLREFRQDVATGMIDLNRSRVVSNLGAPNWAYGNITAAEYKYKMFAMASKYNISKCKMDKPFAIAGNKCGECVECVECPQAQPMFNLGKGVCERCPSGYYFSSKRNNCTKGADLEPRVIRFNSHPKALNFIGKRPLLDDELETCQQDAPFSTGEECVVCRLPLIFSFVNNSCVRCPELTQYSMNLRKCVRPSRNMVSSLEEARNWVTSRRTFEVLEEFKLQHKKDSSRVCHISSPYYDKVSCISCQLPRVFNLDTLLCVTPNSPFVFDQNIHRIVRRSPIEYNTRPDSRYLLIQPDVKPPTNTTNLCPSTEPYFDGITCIQCQKPNIIFNFKSKICTMCSEGKIFDPSVKRCETIRTKYYTDLSAANILLPLGKTIEDYRAEQKKLSEESPFKSEQCPDSAPFLIQGGCRICPHEMPLYNLETLSCSACKATESFWNELHQCRPVKFVTDVKAPNILIRSPTAYLQALAKDDNSRGKEGVRSCPAERPFYNGEECINCAEPHPLFLLEQLKCERCADGELYESSSRNCVKVTYATSPSALNLVVQDAAAYREQFETKRKQNDHFKECPLATPYFSRGKCISCRPEHRLFDLDKGVCVKCKTGLNYHPDKMKCLSEKVEISSSLEKMLMNIG